MSEGTKFLDLKKNLFNQVMQFESEDNITEEFKREFMKLIELCTFSMMEGEDNFFALFTMKMNREIRFDLPTAVGNNASISHFNIFFNPYIFLQCSLEEMKALIKHEVYHIMYNHFRRAENIKGKYSNLAINTAMDISINQYIKNMPLWADTLKNTALSYNIDLEEDLPFEEYAKIIQEGIDKLKSNEGHKIIEDKIEEYDFIKTEHDSEHAHDLWHEQEKFLDFDELKELTKKIAEGAAKGKTPKQFQKIIASLSVKAEISWSDYLKKIIGTLPVGYKKTITRRDRRQPYRLDLRGKLPNRIPQIIVAIDISGSITNSEIERIMAEIFSIVKNHVSEITIIECDNKIRRVYKVRSIKDIKQKVDTKGGTAFSPVFEYIYKHKLRDHLLIYFTDGAGEKNLTCRPLNYKTLWILTDRGGELSLQNPYGKIKKLSNNKMNSADPTYAKDTMKELLMEWAK